MLQLLPCCGLPGKVLGPRERYQIFKLGPVLQHICLRVRRRFPSKSKRVVGIPVPNGEGGAPLWENWLEGL